MKKECDGCEEDFSYALLCQDEEELFFATTTKQEYDERKHFHIFMVDEFGNIIVE